MIEKEDITKGELPRIFIAPRSNEQSSRNFEKTIEGGYKKSDLLPLLSGEDKEALKDVDTLMIWGNKPSLQSKWEKMRKGDWVLFYKNGNISFAGKLLYKTHNKAIANELWGPQMGENGTVVSWEYIFFVSDLKPVNKAYKIMADLAGYKGAVVQGFQPYKEEGVEEIIRQFGSVDNFLFEKELDQKLKPMDIKKESFKLDDLREGLEISGIHIQEKLISRYVTSLLTKPFVILTGLSGSGKTKLALAFALWICEDNAQYKIIPVGADWTNREPLFGYPNALEANKYILPDSGALTLMLEAAKEQNQNKPYFLILDEMNLSHVERYFADFLSAMESGEPIPLHNGVGDWHGVPSSIKLPKNLFVIGTVNIDETTYMFSPKVLDRANVIEFRVTEDEMSRYLSSRTKLDLDSLTAGGASMGSSFVEIASDESLTPKNRKELNDELLKFFAELKKSGAEFGYRGDFRLFVS